VDRKKWEEEMNEERRVYLNHSLHEALNRPPENMMDGDEN
jgi:hypothetical protein